jgi:hypothetical protein
LNKKQAPIKLEVTDEDVKDYLMEIASDQKTIDELNAFIFKLSSKYKSFQNQNKYQ